MKFPIITVSCGLGIIAMFLIILGMTLQSGYDSSHYIMTPIPLKDCKHSGQP